MDRDEMISRIIKLQLYIQNELNREELDVKYYGTLDDHISNMKDFVDEIGVAIVDKNRIGILDQAILDFVGSRYVYLDDIIKAANPPGDCCDNKENRATMGIIFRLLKNKQLFRIKYTHLTDSVYHTNAINR